MEYWNNSWFVGGNIYQPIGKTTVFNKQQKETLIVDQKNLFTNLWIMSSGEYEKAMAGVDLEVGKEFTPRLTGYVGGYYFYAKDVNPAVYGPKVKLTYDWFNDNGSRIFGIFDKIGLEVGAQYDKPRRTSVAFGVKARIGLTGLKQPPLNGVVRHMVDLVRRDVDVVSSTYSKKTGIKAAKIYGYNDNTSYDPNTPPNIVTIRNAEEFQKALQDQNGNIVFIAADKIEGVPSEKLETKTAKWITPKIEIDLNGTRTSYASSNGKISDKWQSKWGNNAVCAPGMLEQISVDQELSSNSYMRKLKHKHIDLVETEGHKYKDVSIEVSPDYVMKKNVEVPLVQLSNKVNKEVVVELLAEHDQKKNAEIVTELSPESNRIRKYQHQNLISGPEKHNVVVNPELSSEYNAKKNIDGLYLPNADYNQKKDVCVATELGTEILLKKDIGGLFLFDADYKQKKNINVVTDLLPENIVQKPKDFLLTEVFLDTNQKKDVWVDLESSNGKKNIELKDSDLEVSFDLTAIDESKKAIEANAYLSPKSKASVLKELENHKYIATKKLVDVSVELPVESNTKKNIQGTFLPDANAKQKKNVEVSVELNPGDEIQKPKGIVIASLFSDGQIKKNVELSLQNINQKKNVEIVTELLSEQYLQKPKTEIEVEIPPDQNMKKPVKVDRFPIPRDKIKKNQDVVTDLLPEAKVKKNEGIVITPELSSEDEIKKNTRVDVSLSPDTQQKKNVDVTVELNPGDEIQKPKGIVITSLSSDDQIKKNVELSLQNINQKKNVEIVTELLPEQYLQKPKTEIEVEIPPDQNMKKPVKVDRFPIPRDKIKKNQDVVIDLLPEAEIKKNEDVIITPELSSEDEIKKNTKVDVSLSPDTQQKKNVDVTVELNPDNEIQKPKGQVTTFPGPDEQIKKNMDGTFLPNANTQQKKDIELSTELNPEDVEKKNISSTFLPDADAKQKKDIVVIPEVKLGEKKKINVEVNSEISVDKKQKKNVAIAQELKPEANVQKPKETLTTSPSSDERMKKYIDSAFLPGTNDGKKKDVFVATEIPAEIKQKVNKDIIPEISAEKEVVIREEYQDYITQSKLVEAMNKMNASGFNGGAEKAAYGKIQSYMEKRTKLDTEVQSGALSEGDKKELDGILKSLGVKENAGWWLNRYYDHKQITIPASP